MTIEVELMVAWIASVSAIAAPVIVLVRKISGFMKRVNLLEEWTHHQQDDIEHSKQERIILLRGTLACLKGLHEQGCNGPVKQGIADIEQFLYEEAHRGKSWKNGK